MEQFFPTIFPAFDESLSRLQCSGWTIGQIDAAADASKVRRVAGWNGEAERLA